MTGPQYRCQLYRINTGCILQYTLRSTPTVKPALKTTCIYRPPAYRGILYVLLNLHIKTTCVQGPFERILGFPRVVFIQVPLYMCGVHKMPGTGASGNFYMLAIFTCWLPPDSKSSGSYLTVKNRKTNSCHAFQTIVIWIKITHLITSIFSSCPSQKCAMKLRVYLFPCI